MRVRAIIEEATRYITNRIKPGSRNGRVAALCLLYYRVSAQALSFTAAPSVNLAAEICSMQR